MKTLCRNCIYTALLIAFQASAAELLVPSQYPTIQAGINSASPGDTVLVAPGTYFENIDFLGKGITVRSSGGPLVTIIDADLSGSCVTFENGEGNDSVLQGFAIQRGTGTGYQPAFGGGIYCKDANPAIIGNIIRDNWATNGNHGCGAGVYCDLDGDTFILSCNLIVDNTAGNWDNNESGFSFGAGVCLDGHGTAILSNNVIARNNIHNQSVYSDVYGGGVYQGGVFAEEVLCHMINNTLTENTLTGYNGNGANIYADSNCHIQNSIIWAWWTGTIEGFVSDITYSNTFDQLAGIGNISEDPCFQSGPLSEYHLASTSLCIDAGNPDLTMCDYEDPANPGNPMWPAQGALRNDMGAYGGPGIEDWFLFQTNAEDNPYQLINSGIPVVVAPNPSSSVASIQYSLSGNTNVSLSIMDVSGRIVQCFEEEGFAGSNSVLVENLPSGVYTVCLIAEGEVRTARLVRLTD